MLPTLASCLAGPTFTFSSSHPWRLCPASQKPEVRLLINSTDMLTQTTHLRALCVFALLRGPAPPCPPRWITTSHASQGCCPGPNLRPSPGKVPEAAVHDGRGMRTWVVHWRRDSHRRHRCLVWWSKHLFRHSARAGRGRTTFCALALCVFALRRHPRPPKCICSPRGTLSRRQWRHSRQDVAGPLRHTAACTTPRSFGVFDRKPRVCPDSRSPGRPGSAQPTSSSDLSSRPGISLKKKELPSCRERLRFEGAGAARRMR